MKGKQNAQPSLWDGMMKQPPENKVLNWVNDNINWVKIDDILTELYSDSGRPSHPPLVLFKMVLLSQWYGLSDPQCEFQCQDRLSFRQFLKLGFDDTVPDETTLCRFRQRLQNSQALEVTVLNEITRQLDATGYRIQGVTLVDASLVPSSRRPPKANDEETSTHDNDATWGKKGKAPAIHGYKVHIGMDTSGLIRQTQISPAHMADIEVFEDCVTGDESEVIADKGYDSQHARKWLKKQRIKSGLMWRKRKNAPVGFQELNTALAKRRSPVERFFADMKQHRGVQRMRYVGLFANGVHLNLLATAFNLLHCAKREPVG